MGLQEPEYKQYIRNVLKNNLHTAKYYYAILAKENIFVTDEAYSIMSVNKCIEERFVGFLLNVLNNNVLSEAAKTLEKWNKTGILCNHTVNARINLFIEDYKIMIKVASNFLGTYYLNLRELHQVVAYFESLQEDLEGIINRMVKQEHHTGSHSI
ncbi:MAG TPA: hypothetical protein VF691_09810 [Cytophagaceae bacterium]|jgi:glutamine synthetase type III